MSMLLSFLESRGYCAPRGVLNPAPRLPANRRRAWLPCFRVKQPCDGVQGSPPCDGVQGGGLQEAAAQLLQLLQERVSSAAISLERLLLWLTPLERQYWLAQAVAERPVGDPAAKGCRRDGVRRVAKYRAAHEASFCRAGLQYPPQPTLEEEQLARAMAMAERERPILSTTSTA